MAAVNPDGEYSSPHHVNNSLIESVHHAIRIHPTAIGKANYGKILAQLLAQQAKDHQAAQQLSGSGRVQQPAADTGGAYLGPGAVADANGYPSNWAEVARGTPRFSNPFMGNPIVEALASLLSSGHPIDRGPIAGPFPGVHGPILP